MSGIWGVQCVPHPGRQAAYLQLRDSPRRACYTNRRALFQQGGPGILDSNSEQDEEGQCTTYS